MTAGFSNPSNNAGSEENGLPRVKSQKPFWLTKNEGNIGTGGRQADAAGIPEGASTLSKYIN
ncbi:hypothetical protein ACEPPN_004447 [Leptodophora sp. 'Broadleaf-Isolate-01']